MRTKGAWGSVFKRKDSGKWRAAYPHPLKPDAKVVRDFARKEDAQLWLRQEHRRVEDHWAGICRWTSPQERREAQRQQEQAERTSFKQYATQWVQAYPARKRLEASSRHKVEEQVNRLLTASWTNKAIGDITTQDITRWIHDEETKNQPYALTRACSRMKSIFATAVEEGVIATNPCPATLPQQPAHSKQEEIPPVTPTELKTLYDNMPSAYQLTVLLGATLGLRIGEVVSLQRRDIDLEHRKLYVRHSFDMYTGEVKSPKTKTSEAIKTIDEDLLPYIEQKLNQISSEPNTWLFSSARTSKPISPNTLRELFNKAKQKAGRPDLHFHTLRATAITTAWTMPGMSPKQIMNFSRHADEDSNLRYQRTSDASEAIIAHHVAKVLLPQQRTKEIIEREIAETEQRLAELKAELAAIQ